MFYAKTFAKMLQNILAGSKFEHGLKVVVTFKNRTFAKNALQHFCKCFSVNILKTFLEVVTP